jgi:hypothetical protein
VCSLGRRIIRLRFRTANSAADTKTRIRTQPVGQRGFFCVIFAFEEIFAPAWETSQLFCTVIDSCVRSEVFFPAILTHFSKEIASILTIMWWLVHSGAENYASNSSIIQKRDIFNVMNFNIFYLGIFE